MADYIRREDALFALRKAERGGSMTALSGTLIFAAMQENAEK